MYVYVDRSSQRSITIHDEFTEVLGGLEYACVTLYGKQGWSNLAVFFFFFSFWFCFLPFLSRGLCSPSSRSPLCLSVSARVRSPYMLAGLRCVLVRLVRSGRMSGRSIGRPSSADRLNKRRVHRSLVRLHLYLSRVYTHIHTHTRIHTLIYIYTHTHSIHSRTHTRTHTYTRAHRGNARGVKTSGRFCGNTRGEWLRRGSPVVSRTSASERAR